MNAPDTAKRHPVAAYFALAFAISWGGILLLVAPVGIPSRSAADASRLFPLLFLAMIAGLSISSLILTVLIDGRAGYRQLVRRLAKRRTDSRWYRALLIAPLLLSAILAALSLISPAFLPGVLSLRDKAVLLAIAVGGGLGAGLFEELRWTGFATPRLLARHGYLTTALLIGIPWAIWHLLSDHWGGADTYGALYLLHFLLWVVALPAYRFLIVWVSGHAGSLLLGILMHASFFGSQALLGPTPMIPENDVLWYGVFAVSLWAVVTVVVIVDARRSTRRPRRSEAIRRTPGWARYLRS